MAHTMHPSALRRGDIIDYKGVRHTVLAVEPLERNYKVTTMLDETLVVSEPSVIVVGVLTSEEG